MVALQGGDSQTGLSLPEPHVQHGSGRGPTDRTPGGSSSRGALTRQLLPSWALATAHLPCVAPGGEALMSMGWACQEAGGHKDGQASSSALMGSACVPSTALPLYLLCAAACPTATRRQLLGQRQQLQVLRRPPAGRPSGAAGRPPEPAEAGQRARRADTGRRGGRLSGKTGHVWAPGVPYCPRSCHDQRVACRAAPCRTASGGLL